MGSSNSTEEKPPPPEKDPSCDESFWEKAWGVIKSALTFSPLFDWILPKAFEWITGWKWDDNLKATIKWIGLGLVVLIGSSLFFPILMEIYPELALWFEWGIELSLYALRMVYRFFASVLGFFIPELGDFGFPEWLSPAILSIVLLYVLTIFGGNVYRRGVGGAIFELFGRTNGTMNDNGCSNNWIQELGHFFGSLGYYIMKVLSWFLGFISSDIGDAAMTFGVWIEKMTDAFWGYENFKDAINTLEDGEQNVGTSTRTNVYIKNNMSKDQLEACMRKRCPNLFVDAPPVCP